MMEMKEQTGSRKKYLAPVVVLMLCLVALTGAAYAYTSSYIVQDNKLSGETFVLEVNDDEGTLITEPITIKGLDFNSDTIHGATKSVVFTANVLENNGYVGNLVINDSDAKSQTKPITLSAYISENSTYTASTLNGSFTVAGATGTVTYTVTVALYGNEECTAAVPLTLTFDANGKCDDIYYKVNVTAASGTLTFADTADPMSKVAAINTALVGETFNLKFVAGPTPASP